MITFWVAGCAFKPSIPKVSAWVIIFFSNLALTGIASFEYSAAMVTALCIMALPNSEKYPNILIARVS